MTNANQAESDWTLAKVSAAERPLLAQLLQLYLHDFSDFQHDEVDEEGRFGFSWLNDYWTKPGFHALLLRVQGKPAGFALVEEAGADLLPDHHYVAEFFVLRAYRRAGYGRAMAWALFDRFPGQWKVVQIRENVPAQIFWRRVINDYTAGHYAEHVELNGDLVEIFDTADWRLR